MQPRRARGRATGAADSSLARGSQEQAETRGRHDLGGGPRGGAQAGFAVSFPGRPRRPQEAVPARTRFGVDLASRGAWRASWGEQKPFRLPTRGSGRVDDR